MRKVILFLSFMLLTCVGISHAQAIFKKYGFNKEPLTLSKGKYKEFFTNDEVVQIGTVKLNTRTNKVIKLLEEDTTKNNYLSDRSSIWYSVDPLAEKFPNYSPYVYCFNNPVRFVDPDGRAPGDFFKSKNAAAKDWANYYNGRSILKGKEYGSTVYVISKNGAKGYTYTKAQEGENDNTKFSPAPQGKKAAANIHSHGKYEKGYYNDEFSNTDKWINYDKKIDGYVATPNGTLQKYDVETAKTTVVSTQIPSDPKDPDRKNKINPTDNTANQKTPPPAQSQKTKKNK